MASDPGIRILREGSLTIITMDPLRFTVLADQVSQTRLRPQSPQEVLRRNPDVMIIGPGPMIECAPEEPHCTRNRYRDYTIARPVYMVYDSRNGLNVPADPQYATRGATIGVKANGDIYRAPGGAGILDGTVVALQGYPSIVEAGRSIAGTTINTERECRVGVAWLPGNKIGIFHKCDSMSALAGEMVVRGAIQGVYMDGGGSGYLASQRYDFRVGPVSSTTGRRLSNYIGVIGNASPHIEKVVGPLGTAIAAAGFGILAGIGIRHAVKKASGKG